MVSPARRYRASCWRNFPAAGARAAGTSSSRRSPLISSDGQVRTIYDGQKSLAWNGPYHSAPSISAEMAHSTGLGTDIADTTLYYHGDQIGSARVMTDANGYLVWQATYLPYGGEFNPEPTNNHYKFTGKE